MDTFDLRKFLAENKNIKEEEENTGAWKSFNTPAGENFTADIKQEISNWNWVADIARKAEKDGPLLIEILKKMEIDVDGGKMGFEIRKAKEGPFGYRGFIFINTRSVNYDSILKNPSFKEHFSDIDIAGAVEQHTNADFNTMVEMKPSPMPK